MPTPKDFARLYLHATGTGVAAFGVLATGAIAILLYWNGFPAGAHAADYQGDLIFLVFGVVLAGFGLWGMFICARWPRRLSRAVRQGASKPVTLTLEIVEGSDSTEYYAWLQEPGAEDTAEDCWRARIWVYPPKLAQDAGRRHEATVFFDVDSARPAAIAYARGVLWMMAGDAATERQDKEKL
ncbi:MAG: hypothetical protein IAE85_20710 [Anaerolinea sp.]|nr:hypothetical protein [Anaerolinea sp.]